MKLKVVVRKEHDGGYWSGGTCHPRMRDRRIGLVRGTTVRSRHVGRDIMAGLKTIVGGEIASYTAMMEDARAEALQRLIADAEARGANAVTEHPERAGWEQLFGIVSGMRSRS
jgi:hypothetical protein